MQWFFGYRRGLVSLCRTDSSDKFICIRTPRVAFVCSSFCSFLPIFVRMRLHQSVSNISIIVSFSYFGQGCSMKVLCKHHFCSFAAILVTSFWDVRDEIFQYLPGVCIRWLPERDLAVFIHLTSGAIRLNYENPFEICKSESAANYYHHSINH